MMSPRPWKIDEVDPSAIRDATGEFIAENYTFLHVDDFESLVVLVNTNTNVNTED